MEVVTIIFEDGTEINAERNGTSLITAEKPDFPEELGMVIITGEDGEESIPDAEVLECAPIPGDERYWFMFVPRTRNLEEEVDQQRADLDFIAAVTGVDL